MFVVLNWKVKVVLKTVAVEAIVFFQVANPLAKAVPVKEIVDVVPRVCVKLVADPAPPGVPPPGHPKVEQRLQLAEKLEP